ncbi:taurine catabolism dioxygenase [Pholiota conissans]|uniref:Taurine catabolism dioxygenase n=1 Tax=Pholiota conissans TaxID=109636 RepID=A0A9P5ZAP5_9AGAR|nr:taurine catabolism dioxygenase [Pholiota conissans]
MSLPSFTGSLSNFEHYDATRHIGTVFPDKKVRLVDLLKAPNSDVLIKDLAVLVSQRGVVFFKSQEITVEQQRQLGQRLGELTGKPETSKLHRHPLTQNGAELGEFVTVISSNADSFNGRRPEYDAGRASNGWHADITFEPVPSDYAILKIHTLPETGGDTLFASGYEAYDRLSEPYKKFLEGLTATHSAPCFLEFAKAQGLEVSPGPRGAPENIGTSLSTVHPVIRTNPVTGFKSLFVNKGFTTRINELTRDESEKVIDFLTGHVAENHDLQVRWRWEKNDIAIWDNRSNFHTATNDYDSLRVGDRVVSLGEKPFFDPNSKSRREALGLKK